MHLARVRIERFGMSLDTELSAKRLKDAVQTYWTIREGVDGLNPHSSYDQDLRGPELRADLDAAGYLVANAADDLLAEIEV